MNILIYAMKRDFDVQKAERYFKERRIPYQFIDLSKKGMGLKELEAVRRQVGLEAMIRLAESFEVPTIAEGVETEEQLLALKAMGCDIVQGYYFSRPLPAGEFEAFLIENRERLHPAALGKPREQG